MPDRSLDDFLGRRLTAREINLHFDGQWTLTHVTSYRFDDSTEPPAKVPHEGIVLAYSSEHDDMQNEYFKRVGTFRNRISLFILQGDDNNGSQLLPRDPVPPNRSEMIASMLENPRQFGRRRRGIPGFNP